MLCGVANCRFSQEETAAFSAMLDLTSSAASNRSTRMTFSGAQRPFGPHARDEQLQAIRASLSQKWHRAFFAFVLVLQSLVVGGLVQLESDELMSDIDAAIGLHALR